jgi:phage terminase small subunit
MAKPLSPKESAFCRAMLTAKDQTEAAIKAGYSPKTAASQASRLLKKVNIKKEIARLRNLADQKAIIDRDRIIREWNKIGFRNAKTIYNERLCTFTVSSYWVLINDA